MSKKTNKQKAQQRRRKEQDIFDAKIYFKKGLKKYLLILLFAVPLLIGVNVLLNNYAKDLSSVVIIIIDIAILLICCILGIVIFTKIDEKKANKPRSKEEDRDPFAD